MSNSFSSSSPVNLPSTITSVQTPNFGPTTSPAMQTPQYQFLTKVTSISSLLQYASASTYIILDIDETIHVNKYNPCSMMSDLGLQYYQSVLTSEPHFRNVPYAQKQHWTQTLQKGKSINQKPFKFRFLKPSNRRFVHPH